MKKVITVFGVVALMLAGCSAPAVIEETTSNTVSNEIDDTSIYFTRVEDEANYANFFETWGRTDSYSQYPTGPVSLYGMSENESNNLYTNVDNTQFVYSASNGHTYKVDMEKVKADFAIDGLRVVGIDGATLYLLNAGDYSAAKEVKVQTSLGSNPVIIISQPMEINATFAINNEFYFTAHIPEASERGTDIENAYKITTSGELVNYGTIFNYRHTEGSGAQLASVISVDNKIYVQGMNNLFEIVGNTMTPLDFGMSETSMLVSNILGSNGKMYGIRVVMNNEYFTDATKPRLSRIYLVEWDNEFNVLAEYDLPNNYGNIYSEFGIDLSYDISQADSELEIIEEMSSYKTDLSNDSKDATIFYNHTFNPQTKELKNGAKFETVDLGKIIK